MLVNLWVDVNDWAFTTTTDANGTSVASYDDFDSLYEWVAEELFAMDEATPENEGSADDNGEGKVLITKITWIQQGFGVHCKIGLATPAITYFTNRHETLTNPWQPVWLPPPRPIVA